MDKLTGYGSFWTLFQSQFSVKIGIFYNQSYEKRYFKGSFSSFFKLLYLLGLYYYWWPPDFRIFTVEFSFFWPFQSEFRKSNFWPICIFKNQKALGSHHLKKQVGNGGSVLLNWTGFDCSHVKTDPSYSISDLQKRFWWFSKDFLGLRNVKVPFSSQFDPYLAKILGKWRLLTQIQHQEA